MEHFLTHLSLIILILRYVNLFSDGLKYYSDSKMAF